LKIILLAESIKFITWEGAHISKTLNIHDYKRRSEGSCNCHTITKLILAAEKLTFNYYKYIKCKMYEKNDVYLNEYI